MMRWSNEMEKYEQVRMAMLSSPRRRPHLGRFSIAPTPMIATCGWLMIGVPISEPNTPGFVIVNVPPALVRLELLRPPRPRGRSGRA